MKIRKFAHGVDLKEAKDEGIKETKIETAKKMLEEKTDVDLISKITNLSEEAIEKLPNNN